MTGALLETNFEGKAGKALETSRHGVVSMVRRLLILSMIGSLVRPFAICIAFPCSLALRSCSTRNHYVHPTFRF